MTEAQAPQTARSASHGEDGRELLQRAPPGHRPGERVSPTEQIPSAPFNEAMTFGLAGSIGAGMFTFHYTKENFSSFYVAGRHLWQDHVAWAQGAANRHAGDGSLLG